MIAAAAMSLSSFTVVMNALRLNVFNPLDASKDKENTKRIVLPNIEREGKNTVVDFSTLSLESFSGTVVNGKGQSKEVSGQGIRIDKLIGDSGFTEARVVADDEYNAVVKPADTANAWIQIESGKARLIVFGDSDSKRAVKNVVRIEVK